MAWTNLTFSFGSVLTSTKMTQLDANLDALAAGNSGSPKIQEAACTGQSCIDQSALKTDTVFLAGSIANSVTQLIALTPYAFFPMVHASANIVRMEGWTTDAASANLPRFGLRNQSGSSQTYDVDTRYVQA